MVDSLRKPPLRTCVACRREGDKEGMLRFVLGPERNLVPDVAVRLPGRGAYTCLSPDCVRTAVQRRQFSRAFKGEVLGADQELVAAIVGMIDTRLLGLLSMANKAGVVVSGSDTVERLLTDTMPGGLLWIAGDASPERKEKFSFLGARAGCSVHVGSISVELGKLLGKEQRTFLLLKPSGIATKLGNELERFRKFIDGGAQEP